MTDQKGGVDRRTVLRTGIGAAAATAIGTAIGTAIVAPGTAHASAATPDIEALGVDTAGTEAAEAAGIVAAEASGAARVSAAAPSNGSSSLIDFIITTYSLAAKPPTSTVVMNTGTTQKIIIHHTAYPNSTDYSVNQGVLLARDIQQLHQVNNGFADTGQHFTVSRGGFIFGHHLPRDGKVDLATWCATVGGVVRQEFVGALPA